MGHLEDRAGLAGRTAISVGGGGGLGRACALDLGRAGMRLGLCDRNAELLAETVATLTSEGVDVVHATLDARDETALTDFFATVGDELHVLLNVVGGTFSQPFEESTPKGWDAIVRTNFTWLLHSIQLAIPRMRAAGGGSIVNFTSIEAHRAAPSYAVYAGMKAAVTNTGRTLAVELAPDGIRVNTIAADITPTEGMQPMLTARPALTDTISIPMGRMGNYEDIGGCALFLASDLSRYVTGQTLHPDGGALASSGWFNWPGIGWRNTPPPEAVQPFLD
jgi:NAD(P)-dependent dehydrogenase (short-subunit alcohol dehydrogenase family)